MEVRNIPEFMRVRAQWLVWWNEHTQSSQRPRKTPLNTGAIRQYIDAHEQGEVKKAPTLSMMRGNANDPANFATLDDAIMYAAYLTSDKHECGIGYALKGDEQVVVFDFDHVIDKEGNIADERIALVLRDLNSYTEFSPSGFGLHTYCVVSPALKAAMLERMTSTTFAPKGSGAEQHSVYAGVGYVTVTGRVFRKFSTLNMECDEPVHRWFAKRFPGQTAASTSQYIQDLDDGGIREQVADALEKIDPDCDREQWIRVGMVLHRLSGGDDRGFELWDEWSRRAAHRYPKGREQSTRSIYRSFEATSTRAVGLGSLVRWAQEAGGNTREQVAQAREKLRRTILDAKEELRALALARGVTPMDHATEEGTQFVTASSFESEATRWLWTYVIPFGHLAIMSGGVSSGKSSLLLKLAADISHARPLPYDDERKRYQADMDARFGAGTPFAKPYVRSGHTYYLTSEMDWRQTARPTLEANGANLDHIHFARKTATKDKNGKLRERPFDLITDLVFLVRDIVRRKIIPDAIFVDPITSFMGTNVDRNVEGDVRSVLEMIADFCKTIGTAFVCVLHQNKSLDHVGVGKLLGSVAFGAVARMVHSVVIMRDIETDGWEQGVKHIALVPEKSNIGPTDIVNVFRLEPGKHRVGVALTHKTDMPKVEYLRLQQKDEGGTAIAPKRERVLAAARELINGKRVLASREAFGVEITKKLGDVSKTYVLGILNSEFLFELAQDGVRLAAQQGGKT